MKPLRRLIVAVTVLLPLAAQAEHLELVHTDDAKDTTYKIDRDSVFRHVDDGHLWTMVEKEDHFVEEACDKLESGSCRESDDPANCTHVMERLCPGGDVKNYLESSFWEMDCAGRARIHTYADQEGKWFAVRSGTAAAAIEQALCRK